MQREKTAHEILLQLCELQDTNNAKNIMLIDKDGKLIDFNQVYMFDATQWTDDDIEEIERNPRKAHLAAIEITMRYR